MMATVNSAKKKDLIISCDPGFDAFKIVVNGFIVWVPKDIVNVTTREKDIVSGMAIEGEYINSHYIAHNSYLVGDAARLVCNEKEFSKSYVSSDFEDAEANSFHRFRNALFEISVMTAIGFALVKYYEYQCRENGCADFDLSDINATHYPFVVLELPEGLVSEQGRLLPEHAGILEEIKSKICKNHSFSIETKTGEHAIGIDLTLTNGASRYGELSQVRAAYGGAMSDDNGKFLKISKDSTDLLPALIVDGGYRTIGIFKLTSNGLVINAESNMDYAMYNVILEMQRLLKEDGINVTVRDIEDAIRNGNGELIYVVDESRGTTDVVDINPIRKEVISNMSAGLMAYFEVTFNNLKDIKSVVVTGGTGNAYYEHIFNYICENKKHIKRPADSVILTDYEFNGEKIDPVFAIAIGGYKIVCHELAKRAKKGI